MRKLLPTAAAFASLVVLAAGTAAQAQQSRGGGAAEGPRHPCRTALMQFDTALSQRVGPAPGTAATTAYAEPTQMRNQGMEACTAGRVEEGRRMIQQATSALRS
jgi:hypothetical protein